ncbi:hypothetical protein JIN77_03110 [Verrucomicrobiaceae bacterium R5-34]|uniref:Uncharacterized protein n=1 Tax=Oceaniferula flava TaxID=2800421 RepID=A0AAE2S9P4_9BACT|nr:hypothetical protein [Oceaniferula flavus]MBK1829701.1 hypothetical protein [Verrucomicrobiaceae bacterium R5-34]MBK1853891.1 hypothetical protein [Oceaniferula flavus]MBM1135197.1 hypothetical protein [Oceaniferula flavus]
MKTMTRAALVLLALASGLTPIVADDDDPQPVTRPSVPDDLIDDPHVREELGVNEFTAPSIKRIFDDLDKLAPLPADELVREMPKRMPLDRTDLAMEIGFLIADGFMAVQGGQMAKIEPLAKDLQRYGRALGAGERVNRHAASLLDNAKKNNVEALKKELTATQRDVETDLIHLRDVDLAHLISLGGWIRALEVSSHAVQKKYTPERARQLYREDIADYYEGSIGSLDPRISDRENVKEMRRILEQMKKVMTLGEGGQPSEEDVKAISTAANKLAALALKRRN